MGRKRPALFKGRHFEPEIIVVCVRWYLRFSLSFRNLEEIMAERNLKVDHVTKHIFGLPASGLIYTGPWIPLAQPSTFSRAPHVTRLRPSASSRTHCGRRAIRDRE